MHRIEPRSEPADLTGDAQLAVLMETGMGPLESGIGAVQAVESACWQRIA